MSSLCLSPWILRARKRGGKGVLTNKSTELENCIRKKNKNKKPAYLSENQMKMASAGLNFLITETQVKSLVLSAT